ncbi:MAG: glycosyl transferase [Herpetosiphonaceae bacterium]|nr:MAG: glycosyl transferase [Herpetosiphonaceae bacterium]
MRSILRSLCIHILAGLLRLFSRKQRAGSPLRVLVVKPDHLGDVLLLTPALRALRQRLPQVHIAALVGPWAAPILRGNPDVDVVLTCPFPGFTRSTRGPIWQPYALLLRTALLLRAGAFDVALIARDDHWWGALLALAAGIPLRIGFAHPLVAPALSEALAWDPAEHVTQQSLALVEALTGRPAESPALRFEPSPADHAWAAGWLDQRHLGRYPVVAIHPGSGGPAKLWPAARWAAVADALGPEVEILITGGKGEEALVSEVAALMSRPSVQMAGEASIGELAALYARCAAVLGVDSGPLHIAVSQGVPTLHLFGPSDQQRFGPWGGERNLVLRSGLWCSPCGVFDRCPRGTQPAECMALLQVAQVVAAARRILYNSF